MDHLRHNREAWDRQAAAGRRWSVPVDTATVKAARRGEWSVILTPTLEVPRDWFPPDMAGDLLGLASAGGQQGPVLAAAGARVTILDNSPGQLDKDRQVGEREGLVLRLEQGNMADLGVFADESFDVIFHPIANCFVPEVRPVWRECYRVLRPGGVLLAGFCNPAPYVFDWERAENDRVLEVKHKLPHADIDHLDADSRARYLEQGVALEWSHSLDDQIGGQLDAGFVITGFYEDNYPPGDDDLASRFMPMFMATRALKPESA